MKFVEALILYKEQNPGKEVDFLDVKAFYERILRRKAGEAKVKAFLSRAVQTRKAKKEEQRRRVEEARKAEEAKPKPKGILKKGKVMVKIPKKPKPKESTHTLIEVELDEDAKEFMWELSDSGKIHTFEGSKLGPAVGSYDGIVLTYNGRRYEFPPLSASDEYWVDERGRLVKF